MQSLNDLRQILPAFPRTPHLPYKPNLGDGDVVALQVEVESIFQQRINIEEKIDGASVGICLFDGHPLIRNRDHILRKGYFKNTAAKGQFRPIWTWFYENKKKFEQLNEQGSFAIYGEWMVAAHGIHYTKLPDWFIAYDIYDYEKRYFLSPVLARKTLEDLGFTVPLLYLADLFSGGYNELEQYTNTISSWACGCKAEGIYLKTFDDVKVLNRFKMVRTDFIRGAFWDKKTITRNEKVK